MANSFEKNQAIKTPVGSYFTPNPLGNEGKVAFVYPGSATAYTGLGKDIFQLFPELLTKYESQVGISIGISMVRLFISKIEKCR